jgi:hypothetical protein
MRSDALSSARLSSAAAARIRVAGHPRRRPPYLCRADGELRSQLGRVRLGEDSRDSAPSSDDEREVSGLGRENTEMVLGTEGGGRKCLLPGEVPGGGRRKEWVERDDFWKVVGRQKGNRSNTSRSRGSCGENEMRRVEESS